jgi:CheY-like chemotaxis protein
VFSDILLVLSPEQEKAAGAITDLQDSKGWSVIRVSTLTEACELLTERSFDAILLDLFLPDEQGIECFVRTFAEVPDTPVVILISPADGELGRQALRAGAAALVHTDAAPDELIAALSEAAETGALRRAGPRKVRTREEFIDLAERFIQLARLSGKSLLLCTTTVLAEEPLEPLDGSSSEVLLSSLRASDLLTSTGDGLYVALAIVNPGDDSPRLLEIRLEESRERWNATHPGARVEISAAYQRLDPEEVVTAEELMLVAEASLAQQRR